MTREGASEKARRYLAEGRVLVEHAEPGCVLAAVRGDGEVFRTGYSDGGWHCECPARTRCVHLLAIGLVTAPARVKGAAS